ncbi:MAG: hypothetical protein QFB87_03175 [Patescibacteria group bacterium]|nr:hypothetical protein [Patescibacteria group bacterium]
MTTTQSVLLIILSVFLALFLGLAIALTVLTIKLVKSVKRIVLKAEEVVDSVETAAEVVKNASGPLATLRVIKNIVDLVNRKK